MLLDSFMRISPDNKNALMQWGRALSMGAVSLLLGAGVGGAIAYEIHENVSEGVYLSSETQPLEVTALKDETDQLIGGLALTEMVAGGLLIGSIKRAKALPSFKPKSQTP